MAVRLLAAADEAGKGETFQGGLSWLSSRLVGSIHDHAVGRFAQAGTSRFGMGDPANSLRQGFAIHRAHRVDRSTRALSVAMPVFAYI